MSRAVPSRSLLLCLLVGVALIATLLLAACVPDPTAAIISPNLGAQLAAEQAGGDVAVEPTPVPPKLADLPADQVLAGLPADLLTAVQNGDVSAGPTLATTKGCIGCHSLDPNATMTGPTWHNVADHAIVRVPGESPAEYLHQSIVNPNAFVVPNFPANIMPQTYSDMLTTEELGDLIAYLLTQTGQP